MRLAAFMLSFLEKRLIMAFLILIWLVWMIERFAHHWGGSTAVPPNLSSFTPMATRVNRARQIEEVLSVGYRTGLKPAQNISNPFYPNPTPPPPPPPPPPPVTTRKVELLYQGYYVTSRGEKKAYLLVGDQLLVGTPGAKVTGPLVIVDIGARALRLKDAAGKETVLDFNVKKSVELPVN